MTRTKKLILLLCALGAVVAVFFIVQAASGTYNASLTDETTTLFSMESADDATALSWTYDGEMIEFDKNDDTWEYSADSAFPVDEDQITSLLGNLLSVQSTKTINSPEDISQYGLDEPSVTVTVKTADAEASFDFGDATGITGEYYCSNGDGNVYLVSSAIADSFNLDALSLVEKEGIPDMSDTYALSVTNKNGTYDYEKIEDSGITYSDEYTWFYDEDGDYTTMDNELFASYLGSATGISFTSCVNYNATDDELAEYGLDDPAVKLNVSYTRTEEVETDETDDDGNVIYETNTYDESFELELGEYDGDYCYARIPGSKMVYQVAATAEDAFVNTSIDALTPDDVINLDYDELTSFDMTYDGETYTVTRTDETDDDDITTSVYKYNDVEIDVASLLNTLNTLSSSGDAEEPADGSEPMLSFTFNRDNEDYPVVTLEFYRYDSSTYITVLNGEATVLTDSASANDIAEGIISAINGDDEEADTETTITLE